MKSTRNLKMFTLAPAQEKESVENESSAFHYQNRKQLIAKSNKGQQKQAGYFKNQIKEDVRDEMERALTLSLSRN